MIIIFNNRLQNKLAERQHLCSVTPRGVSQYVHVTHIRET